MDEGKLLNMLVIIFVGFILGLNKPLSATNALIESEKPDLDTLKTTTSSTNVQNVAQLLSEDDTQQISNTTTASLSKTPTKVTNAMLSSSKTGPVFPSFPIEFTLRGEVHNLIPTKYSPSTTTVSLKPETPETQTKTTEMFDWATKTTVPNFLKDITWSWVVHTVFLTRSVLNRKTTAAQQDSKQFPGFQSTDTVVSTELILKTDHSKPQLQTETQRATTSHLPDHVLKGLVVLAPEIPLEPVNVSKTETSAPQEKTFYPAEQIYGNRKQTNSVYKYIFPLVIGVCLLSTILLVYFLLQRFRRSTSQMNKASCLLLIAVAFADILTACFALAEICFIFNMTKENDGFLPPDKCRAMLVLERLSAIPHAASTWLTVILAIHRYFCVSKPFSASKHITLRYTFTTVMLVSALMILFHVCRFFDQRFMSVNVLVNNTTIVTCKGNHADWIQDPTVYESVFVWTRIVITQFIPGILMIVFVALMIISLRKTSKRTKHMKLATTPHSDRNQLSLFVTVVALIVFCVEISSGIFLAFNAWEVSTGQVVVSYISLKSASTALDLVLYVSYFAIFFLYCLMSKDFRMAIFTLWCVRRCHLVRDQTYSVSNKSTAPSLLPLEEKTSAITVQ